MFLRPELFNLPPDLRELSPQLGELATAELLYQIRQTRASLKKSVSSNYHSLPVMLLGNKQRF